MNRQELEELDHSTIQYMQFLLTCISYKQEPAYAFIYDTDKNRQTFDIYKLSSNGFLSTKKLTIPRKDTEKIKEYLLADYPGIKIRVLDDNEITQT